MPVRAPLRATRSALSRWTTRSAVTGVAALTAVALTAPAAMADTVRIGPESGIAWTAGTARAEIAANYGAPAGFGRTALELDTVDDPANDYNAASATLTSGGETPTLPVDLYAGDLTELSMWAYRDGASTLDTLPRFSLWLRSGPFDMPLFLRPQDDPRYAVPDDTWTRLDLTQARWFLPDSSMARFLMDDQESATLQEVLDAMAAHGFLPPRIEALGIWQGDDIWSPPMGQTLSTAFDGLTVRTSTRVLTFDFEAAALSKDDCKDDGWRSSTSGGPWKNQGACIAAFLDPR